MNALIALRSGWGSPLEISSYLHLPALYPKFLKKSSARPGGTAQPTMGFTPPGRGGRAWQEARGRAGFVPREEM